MKWFIILLPTILKRINNIMDPTAGPIEHFKELISQNIKKIIIMSSTVSVIKNLFIAGVIITTINITNQYDAGVDVKITAGMIGGLGLLISSLFAFITIIYFTPVNSHQFYKNTENGLKEKHFLEESMTLLINEFIHEKELKRKQTNNETIKSEDQFEKN